MPPTCEGMPPCGGRVSAGARFDRPKGDDFRVPNPQLLRLIGGYTRISIPIAIADAHAACIQLHCHTEAKHPIAKTGKHAHSSRAIQSDCPHPTQVSHLQEPAPQACTPRAACSRHQRPLEHNAGRGHRAAGRLMLLAAACAMPTVTPHHWQTATAAGRKGRSHECWEALLCIGMPTLISQGVAKQSPACPR